METHNAVTGIVVACILVVMALTAPLWITLFIMVYAVVSGS